MRRLISIMFTIIFILSISSLALGGKISDGIRSFLPEDSVEILSKRTLNSKTFDNGNRTYTTVIADRQIHYLDEKYYFYDIDDFPTGLSKIAKTAEFDSLFLFSTFCSYYYSGGYYQEEGELKVGYCTTNNPSHPSRFFRQMVEWYLPGLEDFEQIEDVTDLYQTFITDGTSPPCSTKIICARVPSRPEESSAQTNYTNSAWPFPIASWIRADEQPDTLKLDLTDQISTFESRIGGDWFAVGHKMHWETSTNGVSMGNFWLYVTYTTGGGKIAVKYDDSIFRTYPNPFNTSTTIEFSLNEPAHVLLEVYFINGQKAATLVDGRVNPGLHSAKFNATGLATGIYLYQLRKNGMSKTGKMLFMK